MKAYLEDVFKTSGIPTHTFVRPDEYNTILVSLRTKGRCLVVEGPSGIGKTTCVIKVIEELGLNKKYAWRSKKAAQYGTYFDRSIAKLARKRGFIFKQDYIKSL